MNQEKSKAELLFTATRKKDDQFLIEKEKAKQERVKKRERLKALRLGKEASDRETGQL